MIYNILRPTVRFALKLYFKNIYISGLENLPKDKPVILVSNHPTAFIEPCLLACFLPLKLHFLVRGDLFSKSWLSWLLKGTNQIPIFRQKDGLDNVRKNLITQEHLFGIFKENKALLMFPEAHTHENIFLRKLKKGLARFAFMEHNTDLHIVPIGINFDRNVLVNSKASVKIGQPLKVSNYNSGRFKNEAERVRFLLDDVSISLKNCMRHIDNEEREEDLHKAFAILDSNRKTKVFPIVKNHTIPLEEEIKFAQTIDNSKASYHELENKLSDTEFKRMKKPRIMEILLMLIFLPIYIIGVVLHSPAIALSKFIVNKKVTSHEFKSPVFIAIMVFFNFFVLLVSLVLLPFFTFSILMFLTLYSILGILAVLYLKAYEDKWSYLLASKSSKSKITSEIISFSNQ